MEKSGKKAKCQVDEQRIKTDEWLEGSWYHLRDTLNAREEQLTAGAPESLVGRVKLCYVNSLSMQFQTLILRHFPFMCDNHLSCCRLRKR